MRGETTMGCEIGKEWGKLLYSVTHKNDDEIKLEMGKVFRSLYRSPSSLILSLFPSLLRLYSL